MGLRFECHYGQKEKKRKEKKKKKTKEKNSSNDSIYALIVTLYIEGSII